MYSYKYKYMQIKEFLSRKKVKKNFNIRLGNLKSQLSTAYLEFENDRSRDIAF